LRKDNQALIISTLKLPGLEQMALDLHFLEETISKDEILFTLRFYHWEGDWISLGYHQKVIPPHWEKLLEDGFIKIVRRPSGGGAVLHSGGITYALTFKKSSYKSFSYELVNNWLIESFNKLGFPNGLDLGLAMATMGLLSSSILGSIFIFLGRTLGLSDTEEILEQKDTLKGKNKTGIFADLRIFIINLGFSGLAISFGVLLLKFLRFISSYFGDFSKEIIFSLPVFPFILIGSLLIRYILEKTKNTEFISNILQREIGILSTDLLIFTAMASLDIAVVFDNWILILVFTIFGLFWNLICIAYFAYFIFDDYWFEKSMIEFGNSTGVVASGLLLLRLADPKNISKTLPIFTSKQLFAQLILSGGLFTVLAPLMISKIGLDYWTEICALITFAILSIALIFNKVEMKKFQ